MSSLVLHTHTGLGDHIITNGMAHSFSKDYDVVYVPHIKMFGESIRALYKEFELKIKTIELPDIDINLNGRHLIKNLVEETNSEYIGICDPYLHYSKRLICNSEGKIEYKNLASNFERQFYELAGMHYSVRYGDCRIPDSTDKSKEIYNKLTDGKDFILVHNGSSQSTGYPLNIKQVSKYPELKIVEIKPGITNNVFNFVDLIKHAKEIHVVSSSFYTIVDSMFNDTEATLYMHSIVSKHDSQINCGWNNNRWNVIDYDRKY